MASKSVSGALKMLQPTNNGSTLVGEKNRTKNKENSAKEDLAKSDNYLPKKKAFPNIFGRKTDEKSKISRKDACVGTDLVSQVDAAVGTEVSVPIDPERSDSPTDVRSMLLGVHPNERYFELMAEERRKALDEALRENLWLCQEVARLKEENRQLEIVANEGMQYAELLKEALKEEDEVDS